MPLYTYETQFTTEFEYSQAKTANINKNTPKLTVVYLHGLCSSPWGEKPEAIKAMILSAGLDFLRFELAGHGSDIANYAKADFNVWKRQTLEVIDTLVEGDVLMVGSSIGGWLSLIAARERPERVKGLIGLAAAPEYQKDLYAYAFNEEQIAKLESGESLEFGTKDFSYVFTKKLIDSCRQNSLLDKPLEINCPVQLLHGQEDACVPWKRALEIADRLTSEKVTVKLLKHGNHRLQSPSDLAEVNHSLGALLEMIRPA